MDKDSITLEQAVELLDAKAAKNGKGGKTKTKAKTKSRRSTTKKSASA